MWVGGEEEGRSSGQRLLYVLEAAVASGYMGTVHLQHHLTSQVCILLSPAKSVVLRGLTPLAAQFLVSIIEFAAQLQLGHSLLYCGIFCLAQNFIWGPTARFMFQLPMHRSSVGAKAVQDHVTIPKT